MPQGDRARKAISSHTRTAPFQPQPVRSTSLTSHCQATSLPVVEGQQENMVGENIHFPYNYQPPKTQPSINILCLFSHIPFPRSNAGRRCKNTSSPTPSPCKVCFEPGLLRMSCLRPTAALQKWCGLADLSKERDAGSQASWTSALYPLMGWQSVCFFWFASFPTISAEPAPLIVRA